MSSISVVAAILMLAVAIHAAIGSPMSPDKAGGSEDSLATPEAIVNILKALFSKYKCDNVMSVCTKAVGSGFDTCTMLSKIVQCTFSSCPAIQGTDDARDAAVWFNYFGKHFNCGTVAGDLGAAIYGGGAKDTGADSKTSTIPPEAVSESTISTAQLTDAITTISPERTGKSTTAVAKLSDFVPAISSTRSDQSATTSAKLSDAVATISPEKTGESETKLVKPMAISLLVIDIFAKHKCGNVFKECTKDTTADSCQNLKKIGQCMFRECPALQGTEDATGAAYMFVMYAEHFNCTMKSAELQSYGRPIYVSGSVLLFALSPECTSTKQIVMG